MMLIEIRRFGISPNPNDTGRAQLAVQKWLNVRR